MRKRRKEKLTVLAALLTLGCLAGGVYQSTSAYITDEKKVVNHLAFAGEKGMDAILTEPSWDPEKGLLTLPGAVMEKDPQVTNTSELDMDELVALKVEFIYTEACPEGKTPGSLLSPEDMEAVAKVFLVDYNADDKEKGDWVRFEGQDRTDPLQCFYYKKTLERNYPEQGDVTVPLFTTVEVNKSTDNGTFALVRNMGGIAVKISGLVLQQMEGEKQLGLNSAEEAYKAGLFDELNTQTDQNLKERLGV